MEKNSEKKKFAKKISSYLLNDPRIKNRLSFIFLNFELKAVIITVKDESL